MLAWGCTVYKVQRLTLEEVVISLDLVKQRNFNSGQMYVALSRVTSLNGLYLICEFNLSYIRADQGPFMNIIEYEMKKNSNN